jgi:hypothetical protein
MEKSYLEKELVNKGIPSKTPFNGHIWKMKHPLYTMDFGKLHCIKETVAQL